MYKILVISLYSLLFFFAFFCSRFSFNDFWGAFFASFLCKICSAITSSLECSYNSKIIHNLNNVQLFFMTQKNQRLKYQTLVKVFTLNQINDRQ